MTENLVVLDQLASTQAVGNFKLWDSLKDAPAYVVVAASAEHVQAVVRFAEQAKQVETLDQKH